MKKYSEIKQIITKRYGLTCLEDYKAWLADWRSKGGTATQEEADLLSPDNISCRDFWKVCEDMFGTDPICNAADGCVYTTNMEANRTNLSIAQTSGLLTVIDANRFYKMKMVEYGTGLGCVKNYVEVNTRFDYVGIDVNPRIPDVLAATEEGYIDPNFVTDAKETCGLVFSSNVLQHVSWKQRQQFFADAHTMLHKGGFIACNLTCVNQNTPPLRYMVLYGQFILIPDANIILKELTDLGFSIISTTNRMGYHFGFVAQKV